ncbi:HTH-type transcriptional regulator gltC [Fusobacterium necrogenes]|uniref:HTH-type transcriptional regulator gltC n=1 Tax=Fusobacterium necrogenes TaxID=858 RepID=A0A377GVB7_9FUSO|nr:LysR family transcriptional regulator [Fusobacterium necrogenes]STO30908.1 HTH-type transcriptional regulator gltC [Fusobacterium necrogenes]
MNIKALNYFIKVVDEGGFTAASKKLFLCQSALSKSIKNFETELGVVLIDRSSKNFKLTPEGQIFYENGNLALKIIKEQLDRLLDSVSLEKGKIKIGIPPVISTIYFTTVIQKFRELYPSIKLITVEAGANTIKEKVENGEIDIGVIILPFDSEHFNVIPIFLSDNVVIVHKSHPFAKFSEISFIDLKDQNFISLNETYMLYDKILEKCKAFNFTPNIICTSSQWDFIAEMVSLNQGVSILPRPILSKFHSKNIKILNIKEGFPWNVALITTKNKYISKASKIFIEFTKELARPKK